MKGITLTAIITSLILSFSVNAAEPLNMKNNADVLIQHNVIQLKQQLNTQLQAEIKNSINKVRMTEHVEISSLIVKRDVNKMKNRSPKSEEE